MVEENVAGTVPPPPREVGPRASRRSWMEGHVRLWWMLAGVIVISALYIGGTSLMSSLRDARIIAGGHKVEALIHRANGEGRGKIFQPHVYATFDFEYPAPNGGKKRVLSKLKAQTRALEVGKTFEVFIDPNDPAQWMDRTRVNYLKDLAPALMILPLAIPLMAVAWMQRSRVLRVWRQGQPVSGVVVEVKQTGSAPLSRVVRYTPAGGGSRRIFQVLVPARAAHFEPGDAITLLALPNRPERAILPELYQDR